MSYSETITRTDLTNILNEVLPIYNNENIVYGEVLTSAVANTTKTNVSKLVLDAGTWLIVFDSAISNIGSSKQFQSTIMYNGSDKASEQGGTALSGLVRHNLSWIGKFTTQATVYGTMYQNSGSSLSTNTNTLYAIRIVQTPRPTPLVDYIVEQGTSGIWTYRKWNSGIAECWGIYESAITGSTSWGSVYYTTIKTVSFPTSLFIERPSCSITSIGNGVQGWGASNRCTKDEIDVFLMRPTNVSSGTPSLSLHAIGTWK